MKKQLFSCKLSCTSYLSCRYAVNLTSTKNLITHTICSNRYAINHLGECSYLGKPLNLSEFRKCSLQWPADCSKAKLIPFQDDEEIQFCSCIQNECPHSKKGNS